MVPLALPLPATGCLRPRNKRRRGAHRLLGEGADRLGEASLWLTFSDRAIGATNKQCGVRTRHM